MSEQGQSKKITFQIDQVAVYGDLVLAPMDGYSDYPFRKIASECGNAISFSEFVNAIDVVNQYHKVPRKCVHSGSEYPFFIQIFDNDPQRIYRAAHMLLEYQPDGIDINMGCSVKNVSNRGAGAGLLLEPQKIAQIFNLLSASLPIPVTGKIRLGWDENNFNYLQIARIIEDNGGKMITVHGRTRSQKYLQPAVWEPIAEIKKIVNIPVIGNGDVHLVTDIHRMKAQTDCDAVMIGRAAIHNPWILSYRDRSEISIQEVSQIFFRHLRYNVDFYGAKKGLVLFRKYADRYLRPYAAFSGETRQKMLTSNHLTEFQALSQQLFAALLLDHAES
ncbi:MAG: tRNA-dihydrouridine synthase family protein [Chloroflexi bacterium]|nr:tRNA-dihydrouridine synthase family protein [Chloroflexota bacterium]